LIPLFSFGGPTGFYTAAQALTNSVPKSSTNDAKSVTACSSKYKLAFQYSKTNKNKYNAAMLGWRRGTPTVLSNEANMLLEWKRGTPTVTALLGGAQTALNRFLTANPSANVDANLMVIDDQFDTQTAVDAANSAVADGCILGVIGPSSSHIAEYVIPIYSAAGIPMISPAAIDPSLANTAGGTFHRIVLPEDPNDLRTLSTLKAMGITKPAIFEDDQSNPELLSRWARAPNVLPQSLLEWKRGTPTVTSRTEIINKVKADGANGYLFNGYGGFDGYNGNSELAGTFAGELKSACSNCSPLIYGENSGILFMDEKWISTGNFGFDSFTALSNSMPMQFHSSSIQDYFKYFGNTQFLAESYDATKFLLAGILAGNTTRSNLNTFINTKKFNGLSGPISFESNGELSGRTQFRFSVVNQQITAVSGLPSGYVPDEAVSSFTPSSPTLTSLTIKVKDFTDSATASFIDVNTTYNNYRISRLADSSAVLSLPNGVSTITISPNSPTLKANDREEIGIRRSQYEVTISGGAVTSVKDLKSSTTIAASGGMYNLTLPAPTAIIKIGGSVNFKGSQLVVQPYITSALNQLREGDLGYFNLNNEVFLTYVPKYKYDYSISFSNPEFWQNKGYIGGEFLASSLTTDPTRISVTAPTSKITGQLSGTYGANSKVYLEMFEGRWRPDGSTQISADGHFGFPGYNDFPLRVRAVSIVDGNQVSFTYSESFTLTTGSPTKLNLSVAMPSLNVSGAATLEGTGQPGVNFTVQRTDASGRLTVLIGKTDSSGNFSLGLPSDTYTISFNQPTSRDFTTTQIQCVVVSGVSKVCNAALGVPTLVGTLSGIPGLTKASAYLYSDYGGGKWYLNKIGYNVPLNSENKFSFFTVPGTYRVQFMIWANGKNYAVFGPKCVVVAGVKTVCDAAFPTDKFNFKVKNLDGTPYAGSASVNFSLTTTNEQITGLQTTLNIAESDSFTVPLLDGEYKFRINPRIESATVGVSREFTFSVSSGAISSLVATDTTTAITASSGIFSLVLGRPQLAGRVVGSDGVTPLSNMRIYFGTPGVSENTGPTTNASGNFVFNTNTKISNGIISVWALDSFNKKIPTSGISTGTSIESITITNGYGPTNILLTAKVPNLTGIVSAPGGVAKQNFLRLLTLQSGKWIYNGRTMRTGTLGQFGIYLPVGSYRIQTYSDNSVGGLETLGPICVVSSDTPTVCNISMDVPNLTGTVSVSGKTSNFWFVNFTKIDGTGGSPGGITDWGSENNFAAKLEPGTYRASVGLYVYGENKYFQLVNTFSNECVVPSTGSVVCDIAAPAPNLKFKVRSSTGEVLTSSYLHLLQIKSGNNYIGYNNISSNFLQKTSGGLGSTFEAPLLDGSYRLTITPQGNVTSGGVAQVFIFDVSNGVVTNLRIEGTTTAISPSDGVYTLRLRSPALAGRVVTADGATGAANIRVEALLGKNPFIAYTDSNGYFGFNLGSENIDGSYVVRARVNESDNLRADSLETTTTVSDGLGPINLVLNLRAPNVTGTVSGPLGLSTDTWVYAKKLNQNGGWQEISNPYRYTTAEGKFGYNLEPGTYQFDVQGNLERAGGTGTTSANCVVIAGQNKVCDITLPAPNMTGVLKIGGVITQGSVEFLKATSNAKENFYSYVGKSTATNNSGYFGLSMSPGTYRSRVYVWSKNNYYFGPTCVVPDSGNVTCDIDLPATNLRVQVASSSGVAQTAGTAILISGYFDGYRFDGSWINAQSAQVGIFDLNLVNGNYTITAYPGSNQKLGKPQTFNITVESSTVTSIKQSGSTSNLTAASGIYTLTLASSPVAGTVVATDGTTPTPNSRVDLYNQQKICSYCEVTATTSDQSGYFGFDKVEDGQYQMIARQPYADPTKADSLPVSVTVTGGMGSSTLVVPLRTPNMTGVVRGPLGVSAGNWIQVYKVTENNGRTQPATAKGVYTDAQGNFSFNLEAGNYLFYAQADLKSAGGIATTSNLCVVPSSGNVTCNITLNSANLKVKIVDDANAVLEGSWAYIYYAEKEQNSIKNTNPSFSFTSSGVGEVFLEDGTWSLQAEPPYNNSLYSRSVLTVKVASGAVTEVKNSSGETLTVSSGYYSIPLPGVNLKGLISFGGETYTNSSYIQVKRFNGKYYDYTDGRWVYNGVFGFKVAPGTYQLEVRPYSNSTNGPVVTYVSDCVVASSGVATCNVALSSGNLSGKITNELGDTYRYSYANIWKMANGEYRDYQWVEVNSGVFRVNLADGTYRIRVEPYWEYRSSYTSREYEITVVSNAVTQVKDLWLNETVTAVSGVYPFRLGTPSVSGKVLEPGTSTVGVRDVNILVAPVGEENKWIYSTNTDASGNFALTIPDGTYVIRAVPYGTGFQYGKSESQTITVSGGAMSGTITLRLRNPNLTGRIVTPGASPVGLANVNVNIWIENEYFYTWTDSSGQFGVFVDKANPDCPSNCSLMLNYFKSSDYTFKRYTIGAIGNIGDKAIGGVTSRATVVVPQSGSLTLPNQYGYVAVESIDSVTSQSTWSSGGHTDESGQVGLNLETGVKYRLTFYPGYQVVGQFAPKVVNIESFSPVTNETMTVSFDKPNLQLKVSSHAGVANMYGWYQVNKLNSSTSQYEFYSNNYLNQLGEGAVILPDGSFTIRFWPGKTSGVEREISVTVSSGVASGSEISDGKATVVLPTGNISGYVRNQSSVALKEIIVTAVRDTDSTKTISTVTDENGYYELNLDRTYAWTVKAIEVKSAAFSSVSIATASPSNSALSNRNITITIP
jgi:branched-chain amino acid transport system substrate-binding protein